MFAARNLGLSSEESLFYGNSRQQLRQPARHFRRIVVVRLIRLLLRSDRIADWNFIMLGYNDIKFA